MIEELLDYYKEELAYLHHLTDEYAETHPKMAARLGLGNQTITDQHVKHTVDAFAFLNARLRHRLSDDFPEIADSLLTVLDAPHLSPLPAMSIVQFLPDLTQFTHVDELPKGTLLQTDAENNPAYPFMTAAATTLWPLSVIQASINNHVLKITLACPDTLTLNELSIDRLRFFIHAPKEYAWILYEWLMCHTHQCRPVGFDQNINQLLTLFLNSPEHFLFFEIQDLNTILHQQQNSPHECSLFLHFDTPNPILEQHMKASWFGLGCVPVINLFEQTIEPFKLTAEKTEYPIHPAFYDSENPIEIHTITEITAASHKKPMTHTMTSYWQIIRKPLLKNKTVLKFIHTDFQPIKDNDLTITVNTLCTHRHLSLSDSDQKPAFRLRHPKKNISGIRCLLPVTPCRLPSRNHYRSWHILAQLHPAALFSIEDNTQSAQVLWNILCLYNRKNTEPAFLSGLLSLAFRRVTQLKPKVPPQQGNIVWTGLEIILVVDEQKCIHISLFLLGCLLERFFAQFVPQHTFIQLKIVNSKGKQCYAGSVKIGDKKLI